MSKLIYSKELNRYKHEIYFHATFITLCTTQSLTPNSEKTNLEKRLETIFDVVALTSKKIKRIIDFSFLYNRKNINPFLNINFRTREWNQDEIMILLCFSYLCNVFFFKTRNPLKKLSSFTITKK